MDKAIKAGRLAFSAAAIGSLSEAQVAGGTCGRLARAAGVELDGVLAVLRPEFVAARTANAVATLAAFDAMLRGLDGG